MQLADCRSWIQLGLTMVVATGVVGCNSVSNGGPSVTDGNRGDVGSVSGKTSGEPNDGFSQSIIAVFDAAGHAALQGTVSRDGDLDVYSFGAMSPGDEITVDAATPASSLDVSMVLFDSHGRLVAENDDVSEANFDSHIDWIVREADSNFFLAVSDSAFASHGTKAGAYVVDVQTARGGAVPATAPQTLVLDFDGGVINSPVLGMMTLRAFDAADISPTYRDQTQQVKEGIRDTVIQNYERFLVTVLTSDDRQPPSGTRFSRISFGGFNGTAFGLAENVDLYDVDRCDDAIIYTESFTLDQFSRRPSAAEMALAIGNVASHEAGHLLGLNHVNNELDIMDDSSPADTFLLDQEFTNSPLSSDILPIGTQDGVLLLTWTVGLAGNE